MPAHLPEVMFTLSVTFKSQSMQFLRKFLIITKEVINGVTALVPQCVNAPSCLTLEKDFWKQLEAKN